MECRSAVEPRLDRRVELAHEDEYLNLSADQRHDLQTKRAAIDAVREEVGLLLNPEATDADHGAADVTRAPG